MIPAWKRPEKLTRAIETIRDNAQNSDDIEIVVRVTDSDDSIKSIIGSLNQKHRVTHFIGPRKNGWKSMCDYWNEMALHSSGQWLWAFNDDCYLPTQNYDQIVRPMCQEQSNVLIVPEIHRLGGSTYMRDISCPFHLYERTCWNEMAEDDKHLAWMAAPDLMVLSYFQKKGPSSIVFADGLTVFHDRDPAEIEARSKQEQAESQ